MMVMNNSCRTLVVVPSAICKRLVLQHGAVSSEDGKEEVHAVRVVVVAAASTGAVGAGVGDQAPAGAGV